MAASRRISKELKDLHDNPVPGVTVTLPDESDLHRWRITMTGPEHTPFAGGTFHLELLLPTTYPFKPPTLAFRTKVYHPNVANDERGGVCLPLLRPDGWKPATRAADVLRAARERLAQPDPDDALEQAIASEFREKRAQWEKTAREWTARYAKG